MGSFLNVVITRLPMMLEREERNWSLRTLHIQPRTMSPLNLLWPRSFCPKCFTPIPITHLIPVISWIYLRGRCHACQHTISIRYPIVELLTALIAVSLFANVGVSLDFGFKLFFCLALIAIATMDWETGWVPNSVTIPLIGGGLLYSILDPWQAHTVSPTDAIIGAMAGYGLLWFLNFVYKTLRAKEAIGEGDFMLVAAFGAWFGWVLLPLILVIAGTAATAFGIVSLIRRNYNPDEGIRFAPFLSATGITFLFARDWDLLPYSLGSSTIWGSNAPVAIASVSIL